MPCKVAVFGRRSACGAEGRRLVRSSMQESGSLGRRLERQLGSVFGGGKAGSRPDCAPASASDATFPRQQVATDYVAQMIKKTRGVHGFRWESRIAELEQLRSNTIESR